MATNTKLRPSNRVLWVGLFIFASVWPVLFFQYVNARMPAAGVSHAELIRFMRVRRYTFEVPKEKDGWILTVQPIKDGVPQSVGGAGVPGGERVTLFVRRIRGAGKVEYLWCSRNQNGSDIVDDPISKCNVYVDRPDGNVSIGDYLAIGDDAKLQLTPRAATYRGELRLVLTDPKQSETELSIEGERSATPDSRL